MTCIAALKVDNKVHMAGERGASTDDTILHLSRPKVQRIGPYLIGYAGSMDGQRLAYNFDPPKPHPDEDIDVFMHTSFLKALKDFYDEWWVDTSKDAELSLLIAIENRLYEHNSSDMSLNEFSNPYIAIGSGGAYAMGYLYSVAGSKMDPDRIVENAVKAAIKFSPTCSGTIDVLTT